MHVCDDALQLSDFKHDGCVYFIINNIIIILKTI